MPDKKNTETGPGEEMTREEVREFMTKRDLDGLPGYNTYLKESHYTRAWSCPGCGGENIPCSINCPQCGHNRPIENADPDQEGHMGKLRKKARAR